MHRIDCIPTVGEEISLLRAPEGTTLVPVAFRASPFHAARPIPVEPGNICDILDFAGIERRLWKHAQVSIGGIQVPWQWWLQTKPKPGVAVDVIIIPAGGGGASIIPASTVRLLLSVGVQAGALLIPGAIGLSGAASTLAGAALNITGLLAVNALVPPPPITPEDIGFEIQGTRNEARPYAVVPVVFGRHIIYPPHSAVPFTEIDGNDQILIMRFCVGLGPVLLSELKIGQTNIESYSDMQVQVTSGYDSSKPGASLEEITLYTKDAFPASDLPLDPMGYAPYFDAPPNNDESLAQGQLHPNVIRRVTAADTDEIILDFTFDNGLIRESDSGPSPWRVIMEVRIRQVGTATWYSIPLRSETEVVTTASDIDNPRIYQWLSDLNDRLESLIEDIGLFTGSREATPEILDFLQRMLSTVLSRLDGTDGADSSQDTVLANLRQRVNDAISQLTTFASGAINEAIQSQLDSLIQQGNILAEILVVNQYINAGFGPALHTLPEIARILILSQGLEDIFGYPAVGQWQILDRKAGTVRRTRKFPVPAGQYEVDVRRASPTNEDSPNIRDGLRLSGFTSVRNTSPVNLTGISEIAVKARATGQFQGLIDQLSCIASRLTGVWDGVSETQPYSDWPLVETANPAWAYCFALMGAINARPKSVARVDLPRILEWAEYCDDPAGDSSLAPYRFDAVIDSPMTEYELLQVIAHAGRATPAMRNGKFSVIFDGPQSTVTNLYTPRNTRNFSTSRQNRGAPHAVVIEAPNPDAEWNLFEFVVYDDGYSEFGGVVTNPFGVQVDTVAATDIETVRPVGLVDSHLPLTAAGAANPWYTKLAWRYGRRLIAEARLRREVHQFETGINHLRNERGDRVAVQHYVPLWGQNSARIRNITRSGGTGPITHIGVDVEMVAEAATSYVAQVRTQQGTIATLALSLTAGNHYTLALASSHDDTSNVIRVGDLMAFGEATLATVDCIVSNIEMLSDMDARVSCVQYDTGVYDAETGTIPEFDLNITIPPERNLRRPEAPVITAVLTDETVLKRDVDGSLHSMILLQLQAVGFRGPDPVTAVEVQFVEELGTNPYTDYNAAGRQTPSPAQQFSDNLTDVLIGPVEDGRLYTVNVRFLTRGGVTSEFTTRSGILVIGKSTPPADVIDFFREDTWVMWNYDRPPRDLRGFKLRHVSGTVDNWDAASPAHAGIISDTKFGIQQFIHAGPRVLFVKAVDTAGNESVDAARLILNLGDPIIDNAVASVNHHATGFPGTIEGGTVNGGTGDLEADTGTEKFWGGDTSLFWTDDAALFWDSGYSQLRYDFQYTPVSGNLPAGLKLEYTVTGNPYRVMYRTDVNAILWPDNIEGDIWPGDLEDNYWPTGFIYIAWPGILAAEAKAYEFRIECDEGVLQPVISALRVVIDPPDLVEKFNSVSIADTGTRLTLTKTFRAILAVNLTLEDDAGTARTARVIDRSETLGPQVKCYDSSNTAVAGTVDAVVIGY